MNISKFPLNSNKKFIFSITKFEVELKYQIHTFST